jgi:hypothetical protein
MESESMLPVLQATDQPVYLVQPKRFPLSLRWDAVPSDEESIAKTLPSHWDVPGKLLRIEDIARTEANRAWRSMHRHLGQNDPAIQVPESIIVAFAEDLDRKRLLVRLIELLVQQTKR